ncbi:hypothetical protein KC19_10G045600 [Ceratodon purpureus]|uniref:Uncharacterized protein n=1 Tax=Ceratodon purpureus TaxID=3225 RepID=A0A8T0GI25_CERPU|nr:hypothetical protein KC19_10G045600 [Ceratodon purpureus]
MFCHQILFTTILFPVADGNTVAMAENLKLKLDLCTEFLTGSHLQQCSSPGRRI